MTSLIPLALQKLPSSIEIRGELDLQAADDSQKKTTSPSKEMGLDLGLSLTRMLFYRRWPSSPLSVALGKLGCPRLSGLQSAAHCSLAGTCVCLPAQLLSLLTRFGRNQFFLDHDKGNIPFGTVQMFPSFIDALHLAEQWSSIQVGDLGSHLFLISLSSACPKIPLAWRALIQAKEMSRDLWPAKQWATTPPPLIQSWAPSPCLLPSPCLPCPLTIHPDCITEKLSLGCNLLQIVQWSE